MHRTLKKILALTMAFILLAGSGVCSWHTEYAYASVTGEMKDELTSEKGSPEAHAGSADMGTKEEYADSGAEKDTETSTEKETDSAEEQEEEKEKQDQDPQKDQKDGDSGTGKAEETAGEDTGTGKTEEKESEDTGKEDPGSVKAEDKETEDPEPVKKNEAQTDVPAGGDREQNPQAQGQEADIPEEPEGQKEESSPPILRSTLGPHDVDMPDVTSHYFKLQKESKKVSSASGTYLKVVGDVKAASAYISTEMPEGKLYSFTPRMTSSTVVTTGGGTGGGVSFDTVAGSDRSRFGDLKGAVESGNIQGKVYNLEKCTDNPYALYTNVGTWYDQTAGKTWSVDMRITITGYLFPSEKIRDQLNNKYTAPYVGFNKNMIGITVMGTDYVQTSMTFYYHGTGSQISNLRGVIQFCDVDAQQGVDFGSGFQKIIMFNTSATHLQYNPTGIMSGTHGYVSSRTVENIKTGDANTTVLGVFSGPTVSCRWTVSKCDHDDKGGSAAYRDSSGYGIPADSSQADSISYYYSNSTGFLGIYTDLGLITLPPGLDKSLYKGSADGSRSLSGLKEASLAHREEEFTFVLSGSAALPSDIEKAKYTAFSFTDLLEAALITRTDGVKVYTEESLQDGQDSYTDVTDRFTVSQAEQADHRTKLTVAAKTDALSSASFYGRTYYVHIPVRIKSETELASQGLSLTDWYQNTEELGKEIGSSRSYRGVVALGNRAQLYVVSNQGISETLDSPVTGVRVPMRVLVRKFGDESDTPVKGVTFALYGGQPGNPEKKTPLMTAVTDEKGYARFCPEGDTLYHPDYGDGPYYIAELSVPEEYKDVWSPSPDEGWTFLIPSLKSPELLEKEALLVSRIESGQGEGLEHILWNTPKENPEESVRIYKESSDTKELLSGARFLLMEWSKKEGKYVDLMTLEEGSDEEGNPFYYNAEPFVNSMDNLGRYQILEIQAPPGCIPVEEPWTFTIGKDTKISTHTFTNSLQKVRLELEKKGDDGELLPGVVFQVKAAEDIYAPWASDEAPDNNSSLLVSKGTVVDTIKTDEEGVARSTQGHELYVGEYLIQEMEGAEGYLLNPEPHKITLHYSTEIKEAVIPFAASFINPKMKPSMAVAKLADHTVNPSGEQVKMNPASGRYEEEKVPGIYAAGETVDFKVTVTNTGNTDLYELRLADNTDSVNEDEGYALKDFVEEDSSRFALPGEGHFTSARGEEVNASWEEDDPMTLILDRLSAGDSVEVHFLCKVKASAANAFDLKNVVDLTARYRIREGADIPVELRDVPTEELVDEEGNPLTEDSDMINIPGEAVLKVAKLADKTTGVTLKDGRYEGKKKEGIYEYGEEVDYTITVTNSGTANLYQILVRDTPSERLSAALEPESLTFAEGTYLTSSGQEVHAIRKEEEPGQFALLLDYLLPGDSLELHFLGRIKSGAAAADSLENPVTVSAEYQTGRETFISLPHTPEMEDMDTIGVGVPLLAMAKLADKTTGVSLEEGRYTGRKKTGTYRAGESIIFTLTVTNKGQGEAKDISVTENPSQLLLQYVTPVGFTLREGDIITSSKNNMVTVTGLEGMTLSLDRLAPGDSVDLAFECKVKKEIKKISNLENEAVVSGKNTDGSSIPETEEMRDKDAVNLKKDAKPLTRSPSLSSSYPKTGDSSDPAMHLAGVGLALLGIVFGIRRMRKKTS